MHLQEKPSTPDSPKDFLLICAPLLVWAILIGVQAFTNLSQPVSAPQPNPTHEAHSTQLKAERHGHTVLVIIDSLRREAIDEHMPNLRALEGAHSARAVDTCSANFTLVCVQTMLEGRQSPFVASLHNFTGTQGSPKSIPGALAGVGRPLHMISDYTLDSLYGSMSTESMNVETWPGDHLAHDLRAIDITRDWLEQEDTDVILLHMIGTDKVAHRRNPGHPDYIHHFEQVDAALKPLIDSIDPSVDHLIITGDHGHDQKGHHTKRSVVLTKSDLLDPILATTSPDDPIDQVEVTYLLAIAAEIDLHLDYEGRYMGLGLHREQGQLNSAKRESLARFERAQITAMRAAGYDGETFAQLAVEKNEARALRSWRVLARVFPLILLYFLWLTLMTASWRNPMRIARHNTRGTIILCMLGVGIWLISALLMPWMMAMMSISLLIGIGYLFVATPLRSMWRPGAAIWIIMVLAACISMIGGDWRGFFHSVGEFIIQVPLFFVGMIAIGLGLSRLYSGDAIRTLPAMTTALCIWALPSGVYYYQFGRNIVQSTFIGLGVLLLGMLWRHRTHLKSIATQLIKHPRVLGTLTASGGVVGLLLWQRGSSWIWQSGLKRWLTLEHPEFALPIFIVLSLGFLASLRTTLWRVVAGVNLAFIAGYSVYIGELGWPIAASVVVVALALSLSMRLEVELRAIFAPGKPSSALDDEQSGIWSAAIVLMLGWTMLEGFFFENVAFNFTFDYVKTLKHESEVALASSLLTYFKYAPLLWLGAVAIMERHQNAWGKTLRVLLWVFHVKLLMMLVQISFGAITATEKLHELTTSDVMFVLAVLIHFIPGALLVAGIARVAERQAITHAQN